MNSKLRQLSRHEAEPAAPAETSPAGDPAGRAALSIHHFPGWIAPQTATELFRELLRSIRWECPTICLFGRSHPLPREVAWVADAGLHYRYSGLDSTPQPWPPGLAALRERLTRETGLAWNGVLLNHYRDGRDRMGWHRDDEASLGPEPWVASVSLGATRRFRLRHRGGTTQALDLTDGSLLLMPPTVLRDWQHCLTSTRRPVAPRINLTFRWIGIPPVKSPCRSAP